MLISTGAALAGAAAIAYSASEASTEGGEVNVYSSRHYPADETLFGLFTEETGIKVNMIQGKAEELIERVKLEGAQSPCDVFITVDAGNLWRAQEENLFQSVTSNELASQIPANLRDADGRWFAFAKRARVVVYDKSRVKPEELSTYEDLATEKWRGRILIRSSNNIYNQSLLASLVSHHGPEKAEEWAKGIVANMAREPKGGDIDQIKALTAGEGDIAISNTYYFARMLSEGEMKDKLGNLAVFFPNQGDRGTHINVSGAGVATHAPNRDNAVKLLEFLISPEAQKIFAGANHEYPVRAGAELSPIIAGWSSFKEDTLPIADLGKYNAEAVKIMDRVGWR